MSLEPEEIVVAGNGHLWRAPVGTAFPVNIDTAVDETLWAELGFTSEAGPRFTFGRETTSIKGWQSRDPLRIITTATPRSIKADLMQLNQYTFNTAMGGGTWSTQSAGLYKWTPPAPEFVDEFALIVELIDGAEKVRFCYRKVYNQSATEIAAVNNAALMLPVDFAVLTADGGADPFEVYTNIDDLGLLTASGS